MNKNIKILFNFLIIKLIHFKWIILKQEIRIGQLIFQLIKCLKYMKVNVFSKIKLIGIPIKLFFIISKKNIQKLKN
jgi:hypothetical protein